LIQLKDIRIEDLQTRLQQQNEKKSPVSETTNVTATGAGRLTRPAKK
jgi:hypothetical protein